MALKQRGVGKQPSNSFVKCKVLLLLGNQVAFFVDNEK